MFLTTHTCIQCMLIYSFTLRPFNTSTSHLQFFLANGLLMSYIISFTKQIDLSSLCKFLFFNETVGPLRGNIFLRT
ncbi:rCG63046 [Rattus norvegicus]|uniref:RCG63046 n=1 Tax=Rattus norvegicus TaxID=10116 RepID=A6HVX3_RAT|nr:rCG63046 [Rattus norvegicus]